MRHDDRHCICKDILRSVSYNNDLIYACCAAVRLCWDTTEQQKCAYTDIPSKTHAFGNRRNQ